MNTRERLSAAWGDLAPYYSKGRLEVGHLIIQTRSSAKAATWRHFEIGAKMERERPGSIAPVEREGRARGPLRLV